AAKFMSREYKSLIAKGGTSLLTAPDQDGNTPLHRAVIAGHRAMLEALVKKFAAQGYGIQDNEINKKNRGGNTPLHLAVQFDHPHIVKFLIENGADPTIENNAQVTAL
ncbi:ankyrin repeat-containing domain protein, partial [Tuber borchii]